MQPRSPAESRAEGGLWKTVQLRELGAVEYDTLTQGHDNLDLRARLQQRHARMTGLQACRGLDKVRMSAPLAGRVG